MANLKVHTAAKRAGKGSKGVRYVTVTDASGKRREVATVRTGSARFEDDLLFAIKRSIQAERRENREKLGSASGE